MTTTTSDNVAEWRRRCGEIEAHDRNELSRAMRFCVVVGLVTFVAAIPFLCILQAGVP
jgi:hypothetical protein